MKSEAQNERYEKFMSNIRPEIKLTLAIEGYADDADTPVHRQAYLTYLKKRRRPAAIQMAKENRHDLLQRLWVDRILEKAEWNRLIEETVSIADPGIWMRLLSVRSQFEKNEAAFVMPAITAKQIMQQVRSILWRYFPVLSEALAVLRPVPEQVCLSVGTDGRCLYYQPDWIMLTWKTSPGLVLHCCLHSLLHCIWMHIWPSAAGKDVSEAEADRQVEAVICREVLSRQELTDILGIAGKDSICDDHRFWPRYQSKETQGEEDLQHIWRKISEHAGVGDTGRDKGAGIGLFPGTRQKEMGHISKSRSDYRKFLQPFAVWQEVQEQDPDQFDQIYYCLGMDQLHQTPLIEPLEYREGHKLEQLVIAIDTSGSVKDHTVRRFLEETYAILDEKENFFDTMEVWILQCDLVVEQAKHIGSRREWENYAAHISVHGRGGTDFRPVFRWIADRQKQGELKKLKGLLYFTDGDGIYPGERPAYRTAFLCERDMRTAVHAPKWAEFYYLSHLKS